MKKKRNVNVQILPVVKEGERINIPKEIAKYLLDLSKLVFGGAVITTTLDLVFDKTALIIIAGSISVALALSGIIIFIYSNKRF